MTERVLTDADVLTLKAALGAAVDSWVTQLEQLEEPDPDPEPGAPTNPVAVAGNGRIVITWQAPEHGTPTGYRYGRDGTDATGVGPWSGELGPDARTATLDKLTNGQAYEVSILALYPDGHRGVSLSVTPVSSGPGPDPDPGPGPVPGGRSVKLVGHSGLPFNVTIFNGGQTNSAALTEQAKTMGFARFDGGLSFATRDRGWGAFRDDKLAADIKGVLDAGGLFILSLPHSLDGDARMNEKGAANGYRDQQIELGQWLVSKGLNRDGLVMRLDWESNGGWYRWSAAAPGGVGALREALRHCIDNLRAGGLDKAKFDLCLNMPSSASSHTWADLWPGPGYFSVLSIDAYDAYPPVRSHAAWEAKQSSTHSLRGALAQAAKLSTPAWPVMAAQDEGGNWHGGDGAGDNPVYWDEVFAELMKAPGRVAWLNIYNDRGAPANLFHGFVSNPAAFARVRQIVTRLLAT